MCKEDFKTLFDLLEEYENHLIVLSYVESLFSLVNKKTLLAIEHLKSEIDREYQFMLAVNSNDEEGDD